MSHGSDKRARAAAIRTATLKHDGLTSREIAALVGIKPEQVASRVALGERLMSIFSGEHKTGGAA